MDTKYVVVHLSLGFRTETGLVVAQNILDYIRDKNPDDIFALSREDEFLDRYEHSGKWGIPVDNFHKSIEGHLAETSLPLDSFYRKPVEVMGFYKGERIKSSVDKAVDGLDRIASRVIISLDRVGLRE